MWFLIGAAAILAGFIAWRVVLFFDHPGRHEKPLPAEDRRTIAWLRALRDKRQQPDSECCVRCQRTDPSEPCQGCYCHEPADATAIDPVPPAPVRAQLGGYATIGAYFDAVMSKARRP